MSNMLPQRLYTLSAGNTGNGLGQTSAPCQPLWMELSVNPVQQPHSTPPRRTMGTCDKLDWESDRKN